MEKVKLPFSWLDNEKTKDLPLPDYETSLSAGMDVRIAIEDEVVLPKGEIVLLPTGFAVAIPDGFEIQVRPRSGLAVKQGITLINSPGTIDADYRGEVKIGLINHGKESYTFRRGDRVAQMILAPIVQAEVVPVEVLDDTARGTSGFGSTGKR